ncbi:hypothetical protein IEO21_07107 [Rhodonia placenta]|uniref:Uncharacterized protein n=1 Tax=Rhodonia placenta TaxID=104341 RepID=A0A8H7NYT8_9APHY|nr:hypothetical protein IEO21_07107 [Postia placenta]
MLARAFDDELYARDDDQLYARAFDNGLYVRTVPAAAAGSEAVNWKKVGDIAGDVGKGVLDVLKFFKREDRQLLARAIENELYMREVPAAAAGSEAVNWKKVGHVAGDIGKGVLDVLKFLKREDPLLAREFQAELYARVPAAAAGSEAVNWKKVGHVAGDVGKGLLDVLKFLRREDIQLLARAIGDELYARGMILRLPVNRFPVNRFRFGRIGTVVHPQRSLDDDALFERSFDGELYVREPLDWEKLYNINKTPVNLLKPIPHVQRSLDDDALFERSFDGELYAREPFDLAALRNVNKTPVNLLKPLPANTRVGRGLEDDALFARALSEELLARSGTVLDELD